MNKGLLVEALIKRAEINNRAFVNFYCTSFFNVCVLVIVIKTDAAVAIVLVLISPHLADGGLGGASGK